MNTTKIKELSKAYLDYFPIGVAVRPEDLEGSHGKLILEHFNSLTAENVMKFENIQPQEGRFTFRDSDKIVDFSVENKMKIRGHTFVWHNQTPQWVFLDDSGANVSRELLVERLHMHIKTICKRYGDKIYTWDVVNEAVEDKTDAQLRKSKWYEIIGEDYIDIAFKIARKEAPNAELYYNDYGNEQPKKLKKTYELLKRLIDSGTPIDGVGIQGHWNIYDRDLFDNLRRAIELYASLGIKIQITELDVSMFEFEDDTRTVLEPTTEMLKLQARVYEELFEIFRSYSDVIDGVTFWGVSDAYTWKDNFPVRDRKDWPLLFDVNQEPKEAFFSVVNFE